MFFSYKLANTMHMKTYENAPLTVILFLPLNYFLAQRVGMV